MDTLKCVCLVLFLACVNVTALGSSCNDKTDCDVEHSECKNNVCACKSGFKAASDICVEGIGTIEDRLRLYHDLFAGYHQDLVPDGSNGGPVTVFHSLSIQRVVTLEDGILTMQVWEGMRWKDSRLRWSPEEYNISILQIPSRSIWQPDVILSSSADQYTGFPSGDVHVTVRNDGNVTFIPPKLTKSVCHFDQLDLYQKNEVKCTLKYMSWTRDLHSLDLRLDYEPEMYFNTNPNWNVVKTSAARNVHIYPCCPDSPYVDIEYELQLKRIK